MGVVKGSVQPSIFFFNTQILHSSITDKNKIEDIS